MPGERERARRLPLAALFLVSLTLRPQLIGIGPLLSTIRASLRISHSEAGLLPALVVLCMGVFAPAGAVVARRAGWRATITGAIALLAAAGLLRALVGPPLAVIALTVPVGIATAIAGSVLPVVVKESWPHRPVLGTAVYTTAISVGAALSAAVAVPLAAALGSWRDPLAVFALFAAAAALAWARLSRGHGAPRRSPEPLPRLPLRSREAWLVVAIFALVEVAYYGLSAWLPSSFSERGWSAPSAGELITVINAVTVPVSLALAVGGDRHGSRRFWLTTGAGLQLAGLVGVILAPAGGWAWAVLLGAANGVLFPSMMLLPIDVARRPQDVGPIAALMLGGGFTLTAAAPLALGSVRDATGSFTLSLWLLLAVTAITLAIVWRTPQAGLRRRPAGQATADGSNCGMISLP